MCEPKKALKLCTCVNAEINPASKWVLYRGKNPYPAVGKVVVKEFLNDPGSPFVEVLLRSFSSLVSLTSAFRFLRRSFRGRRALAALNSGTAFDFDYTPEVGDGLELALGGETFQYVFSPAHKWKRHSSSSYFDSLRCRLKAMGSGKISGT